MTEILQGSASPAACHDVALLDLDGVVYAGPRAVPGAIEALREACERGMRLAYVTNNASRPPGAVAEHLVDLGLDVDADDVVTSSQAGASIVARLVAAGSAVLAVGGPGVSIALSERGLRPVRSADDDPAAVMQGFGPDVSWRDLAEASYAVSRGIAWVATNADVSVPTDRGIAPGNGSMVRAIAVATGREPDEVAGKPHRALFDESVGRSGAERPIVVGDRLDTDIRGANAAGLPSLLVMTGVTSARDLLAAAPEDRPSLVSWGLEGLLSSHPAATRSGDGWACGSAYALVAARSLEVRGTGIDALRACCAAAWHAMDSGGAPHVPGSLVALLDEQARG